MTDLGLIEAYRIPKHEVLTNITYFAIYLCLIPHEGFIFVGGFY